MRGNRFLMASIWDSGSSVEMFSLFVVLFTEICFKGNSAMDLKFSREVLYQFYSKKNQRL